MSSNNDQLYIDKVLSGDTNAFAVLVDRYKNMVFTLALKVLKHREEAEEVAQDTFIKAFKSLKNFKGTSKFSTWLYKIAYHNCLDRTKKFSKAYQTDTIDEYTENRITSGNDTGVMIERNERAELIQQCMNLLPEDERTILWLFYYEEMSLKEIVEVTSLTESNIKVKLHRARKHMLAVVQENVEPEIISHYGKR